MGQKRQECSPMISIRIYNLIKSDVQPLDGEAVFQGQHRCQGSGHRPQPHQQVGQAHARTRLLLVRCRRKGQMGTRDPWCLKQCYQTNLHNLLASRQHLRIFLRNSNLYFHSRNPFPGIQCRQSLNNRVWFRFDVKSPAS